MHLLKWKGVEKQPHPRTTMWCGYIVPGAYLESKPDVTQVTEFIVWTTFVVSDLCYSPEPLQ